MRDHGVPLRDEKRPRGWVRATDVAATPPEMRAQYLAPWGSGPSRFVRKSLELLYPLEARKPAVLQGRLRHGGHPILKWRATNVVVVVQDHNENVKPDRAKSTE